MAGLTDLNEQDYAAPRARFGMPLNIKFKDKADQPADGAVKPLASSNERNDSTSSERWTSPLRLRPLKCSDGFVSLMIYMNQALPSPEGNASPIQREEVVVELIDKSNTARIPVSKYTNTSGKIEDYLKKANGDSVKAFLLWSQDSKNYQEVILS